MFTAKSRHHLLQRLFWNSAGAALVHRVVVYERKFDVVVRNYSLNGDTNGERWLLTLMDEDPVILDVGFHDGASTTEMLRARPKACVTGFDPSRFARASYDKSFATDVRVRFENVGLAEKPGELEFFD